MADIFVSYTNNDRDWALWIAGELKALGHVPRVHEWEITGSADIYTWMEARHDAADHVLCVISDEYLKAPYSTLERNAAAWQAAKNRPGFILLVVIKPCRLPTLSDHLRRCELFDMPEEAARLRFRADAARRQTKKTTEDYSTRTFGRDEFAVITDASAHNESRFKRDYKGKLFSASGTLQSIDEGSWLTDGQNQVNVRLGSFQTVYCFKKLDSAMVANWPSNMPIKITGIIDDTVLGQLNLKDCNLEAKD